MDRAIDELFAGNDFRKAKVATIQASLVLLLVIFGALITRHPAAAGRDRGDLSDLAARHPRPLAANRQHHLLDRAAGRDGGRHRLLAVLPAPTREERAAGRSTAEALRIAAHASGRAIVVSGLTVMIALAGLFLTGIDVFTGVAIGTILVVRRGGARLAVVLPAILSMLGPWTDRGRISFLGRRRTAARNPSSSVPWPAPWSGARWPGAASPPSCWWR